MRPELKLLRRVEGLPLGQKIAIGPLAREFYTTQATILNRLQWLVDQGRLDAQTLRPPVAMPSSSQPLIVTEVEDFLARHGMAHTRFGYLVANDYSLMKRLRRGNSCPRTIAKVRAFMRDYKPILPSQRGGFAVQHRRNGQGRFTDIEGASGTAREASCEELLGSSPVSDSPPNQRRDVVSAPTPGAVRRRRPRAAPTAPEFSEEFKAVLDRVSRGEVGIAPVYKPGTAVPDRTFGGVSSAYEGPGG
jgi:hypothetical protein